MSHLLEIDPVATSLEQQLQALVAQARTTCSTSGDGSNDCAVAWDAVEEVQAAAAHRRSKGQKTNFERYCDERPDALECRIYDV